MPPNPVNPKNYVYLEEEVNYGAVGAAVAQAQIPGDFAGSDSLIAQLKSDAPTGTTPTLNAVLEDSIDGVNWNTIATFAQLTSAVNRDVQRLNTPFGERLRLRTTAVGGTTPSFPNLTLRVASQTPNG